MLRVKEITNKKIWENFLLHPSISFYPFFQAWNWGEVQQKLGYEIKRVGLYEDNILVGVCLIVLIRARRGRYVHLRHGPVLSLWSYEYMRALLEFIFAFAKEKKMSFIRLSPLIKDIQIEKEILQNIRHINAPVQRLDAEYCWVLDITKSEEELLKNMRKTHRYLIKKAQTINIIIKKSDKLSDLEKFARLYESLSYRKHFVAHKGLKEEFLSFTNNGQALLFLAEFEGKTMGGAFISFVGNMAIYRHGALDEAYKHIPASYLLQWEAIKEAKKRSLSLYNFWGIAPQNALRHPWKGLTLFKTGFGGEVYEFLHAQDIPLSAFYIKTFLVEYFVKLKKGY